MATVRDGAKSVLIVVDMQVGVVRDAWEAHRTVRNVARAVERARERGVPVVWVQHADDELASGSPDWQLAPELVPADGERVIHKQFNSSFEQTELDEVLEELDVARIALAGTATNWCIRATAYGALDRGYDLTLIKDAHTTESIEFQDGRRIEAASIIDELNIAMTWVSYPDRTNTTATAEEIDFN